MTTISGTQYVKRTDPTYDLTVENDLTVAGTAEAQQLVVSNAAGSTAVAGGVIDNFTEGPRGDQAGVFTFTTTGAGAGTITFTYGTPFEFASSVIANTSDPSVATVSVGTMTTTGFTINVAALGAGGPISVNYVVLGYLDPV